MKYTKGVNKTHQGNGNKLFKILGIGLLWLNKDQLKYWQEGGYEVHAI